MRNSPLSPVIAAHLVRMEQRDLGAGEPDAGAVGDAADEHGGQRITARAVGERRRALARAILQPP